ncbi:hypothetical protein ACFW2V_13995 [Streptomyces sp. NPDC058947]|uniref:hypothetical protein n=1 Tax=Streptomyces sp. NPDC058947 TaxID=3346675 RepID=UPI0036C67200
MAAGVTTGVLSAGAVDAALTFAGLKRRDLKRGPHPDDGHDCLYLEAPVQQYSQFLVALAAQYHTADRLLFLTDRVRLQYDSEGDTQFWLPGVEVPGI